MCKLYNLEILDLVYDKNESKALSSHITSCKNCQERLEENQIITDTYKSTLKHVPSFKKIKSAVIKDVISKSLVTATSLIAVMLLALLALPLNNTQIINKDGYNISAKSDNYMDIKLYELEEKVSQFSLGDQESFIDAEISSIEKKLIELKSANIF